MKTARQHTRDRHEDRCERQEKLGQAMDTLPGKTLRDRIPATARGEIPRSKATRLDVGAVVTKPTAAARPGSKPADASAKFTLFAPKANSVAVAGTFNAWDPASTSLTKQADGSWHTAIDLKPGAYEYRFIVDGSWQEDPRASHSVPNPFGSRNSIKHVT